MALEPVYPPQSEALQILRNAAREMAERELAPRAAYFDEHEEVALESFRKVADMGITGLGIAEQYGGSGGGYRELAIAVEEISRACASTGVMFLASQSLATQTICQFGSHQQKQKYLPPLAKGKALAAFAYTEPEAGSDAGHLKTQAIRVGEGYRLRGRKVFITNGDIADTLVVFANTDPKSGHGGIVAFIMERDTPGFSAHKQTGKLGIRGSSTAELVFEDAFIPKVNRLGPEGQGFKQAMQIVEASRVIVGAQAVGIAQAALDEAVRYAKQRQQFGKTIGEFQGLQWMLADMATRVEAARLLVSRAAYLKDTGKSFGRQSSMAKLYASEAAMWVTTKAIQVFGGYGYFREAAVQRYFR
ncbi:MAG: acyl-CoA dehydrogenase family protein, partial [Chloroflexi bacterium]|nr:acyl-CoA dehydrogenase family protein [Chloroflexota bacterium]